MQAGGAQSPNLDEEAILVRTVEVGERVSSELKAPLSRAIESAVIAIHSNVVTPQAVDAAIGKSQTLDCDDTQSACIIEIANALGASLVLRTRIDDVATTRVITFSLLEADNAKVRAQITERLPIDDERTFASIEKNVPALFGDGSKKPEVESAGFPFLSTSLFLVSAGAIVVAAGGGYIAGTTASDYYDGELLAEDASDYEEAAPLIWGTVVGFAVLGIASAGAGYLLLPGE